ncbi:MAG TPA: hypothetical protein VL992_21200 [Tepidisphaeraceae bacterium]|nr:hypothetical protein [Tepidisphaeraceae bacterium]
MKRTAILMAAAMAVGGVGLTARAADSAVFSPNLTDSTVRQVIARLTDDAMAPHDMRRLVANFPVSDMRHLMNSPTYDENYGQRLDSRIERICKTWRQKYGHDFEASQIAESLDSHFALIPPPQRGATEARIKLIAAPGEQEVGVSIVRDRGIWSVALPHYLTAGQLRANLLAQLDSFDQKKAYWPAREDDAYRQLSRHVLLAVLGEPAMTARQSTPAAAAAPTALAAKPAPATAKPDAPVVLSSSKPQQQASAAHHWWQFWDW